MKAKMLSFPFICFSESGLFNELRPIQIKKSFSFLRPRTSRDGLHEAAYQGRSYRGEPPALL
jgi:hypothetical protein